MKKAYILALFTLITTSACNSMDDKDSMAKEKGMHSKEMPMEHSDMSMDKKKTDKMSGAM